MRQFVSIITGCLLSVRLLVAVDFSPYNTPDAPVWSDVRDKIHRTYRTLVYDAFHARGEQDPERTEEFNKHMLLAIDMATGYSVSEKTVRAVFNRVDVQSRWHPDTMAKWTSAIISDGTTHQRSKLHHKWNAARKAFVTDVVDEKRRYNIILLWPVFTVELRNWYWQPHGVRIEAKRNLIRDLSIVFEQGMQAGDELSPEFLFHLMDDLTPRNFPVEEGNLAAYALEQFGPVLDAAAIEPWVRDGLKGILHNEIAWALRGNGWASDVSKAGWEGFRTHVAQATALFEASYAAQPHP